MLHRMLPSVSKVGPLEEKRANMLSMANELKSSLQQLEDTLPQGNNSFLCLNSCLIKRRHELVEQYKTAWLEEGNTWTLLDEFLAVYVVSKKKSATYSRSVALDHFNKNCHKINVLEKRLTLLKEAIWEKDDLASGEYFRRQRTLLEKMEKQRLAEEVAQPKSPSTAESPETQEPEPEVAPSQSESLDMLQELAIAFLLKKSSDKDKGGWLSYPSKK